MLRIVLTDVYLTETDGQVKRGQRIQGITYDLLCTWHVTLVDFNDLVRSSLSVVMEFACIAKVQSDRLKGEFGVIRQLSGGKCWISMKQLISNLCLRKLNLYQRYELEVAESVNKVL